MKLLAFFKKLESIALVGWLRWFEHHPVHQRVVGLFPSQDTGLGGRPDPESGRMWGGGQLINVSLCRSLSASPSLSLSLSEVDD